MKKLRPLGEVTDDLEPILYELTGQKKYQHKMQMHELIGILYEWAEAHNPDCIETYLDGTRPILYGHKDNVGYRRK